MSPDGEYVVSTLVGERVWVGKHLLHQLVHRLPKRTSCQESESDAGSGDVRETEGATHYWPLAGTTHESRPDGLLAPARPEFPHS